MNSDIDSLIILNLAGIGYIRLKSLIACFGSAKEVLRAKTGDLEKVRDIGTCFAERISSLGRDRKALKTEWDLISKNRLRVFSVFSDDYPENLKNIYDPPIVLYVRGKRSLREDKIAVALVGSRRASMYGVNICQKFSCQLASRGVTVVSGLARGIDSAAHRGALSAKGVTLAVLGCGLNRLYPPENKNLADEIADSGAIISEFPMDTPPLRRNFPIRNRIISGLSLGVVIVEAACRSGALITADCALEQGREVFAVPGRAGSATSSGTHGLIKRGAKLAENVEDIITELNLVPFAGATIGNKANGIKNDAEDSAKNAFSEEEKRLYDILCDEPEHIDSIIDKSRLSAPEVADLLLKMELKRLVKELPGKNYVAVG